MVHFLKAGSHVTSTFSYLGAHRVHHLDVQKHSAECVLELVYAPERPGLDPRLHDLEVRLQPAEGGGRSDLIELTTLEFVEVGRFRHGSHVAPYP